MMDTYSLSPLQEGLLFHSLMGTAEERPYHNQMSWELEGAFEPEAYRRAWEGAIRANAVLRTGFEWEGVEKPLQVVWGEVELPFEVEDLSGLGPDEQKGRLEEYLAEDLRQGFELDRPPLLRLRVFGLGEQKWEVVWSFQHLILDGWSVSLLLEEVSRRYESARQGEEAQIEERRPYREYIGWLQQQDLKGAEGYWRELLAGIEEPTPLPKERSGESGYGEVWRRLNKEEVEKLKRLARGARVTLSTVVAAAWGLLLSRYSGEEEVVFGATSSGRPGELKGVEEMLGLFINTLPVRVKVVQEQRVRSREYEYSPLAKVQAWSQISAGQPLFESIVVFENYGRGRSTSARDLHLARRDRQGVTNYPMTLVAEPHGSELALGLSYQRREFSQAQVERLLGHLHRLLGQLAEGGERQLREISLLSEEERRQVLVEWNQTEAEYPKDKTVHELFEEQVERTPEAVALAFEGEELSYRELNRRANRMAHRLRELGVGPEALVALFAERSLEMVVGLLGILKAGGAYVPLDPSYPRDRLDFMLEDTEAAVLLTQQRLLSKLPEHERVVLLEEGWEGYPEDNLEPLAKPENLAYVIYTSGSTGRPKGVMVEHRNTSNFIEWVRRTFVGPRVNCVLAGTSTSFDLSIFEIWACLAVGFTVMLVQDIRSLIGSETSFPVTVISSVPSAVQAIANSLPKLPDLQLVNLGGESLPSELVQLILGKHQDLLVRNLYGPTETTTYSTVARIDWDDTTIPIGKPIQNTQVYVLDCWGELVPAGVAGGLYIGGAG